MSPVDRPSLSLWARDAVGDLKSAPDTFSSWDKCMAKSYCKWPVIVGIIIGAVILLSVIAPKYLDEPDYHHQPPPMPANDGYRAPPGPPVYRGAQVARFESPTSPRPVKVNEDALPAMPSWNDAVTRRVEDKSHQDTMEMEPLNPTHQDYQRVQSPGRFNTPGQMGVPPTRTQTSSPGYFHASSPYDDERQYNHDSSGPYNPGATSPYDRTYHDYSPRSFSQPMPRNPAPYSSQTQYSNMPKAMSPSAEMPRHLPYRQPSPGMSSMAPPPSYRGMSPNPPTSPPPPFSATNPVPLEVSDPGRPPSILQSGRKPVSNSYRAV
ncbi:hypothetical protein CNMCM5623_009441 [Aspergillus felis]|uniref:Uncharacterized protein n=1 Tax=Aspergillus felis TaxID=1287682 RepID=A0A8H6US81_9EURO|nr:hypothetical protein CNMCM5623_009441 [Aspergillus felis]KAF7179533.1 hypothetical protein CNMCM7691_008468 [Aspergillus felis]